MSTNVTCVYTLVQKGGLAATLEAAFGAVPLPTWLSQFGLLLVSDVTILGPPITRTVVLDFGPTVLPAFTAQIGQGAVGGDPVVGLTRTAAGLDLVAPPILTLTGGGVGGGAPNRVAQARALLDCAMVAVDAGGHGYGAGTTIVFSGGLPMDGSGRLPAAHATIVAGVITAVVLDDPGENLVGVPSVTVVGGGGAGALLHARMEMQAPVLIDGGLGYVAAPTGVVTPFFKSMFPDTSDQRTPFYNMLTNALRNAVLSPVTAAAPALA